jgi:Uma2 family endonuclease
MSTIEQKRVFTPEDLLTMPDGARFELVDGELVERNLSVLSSMVEGLVYASLLIHARDTNSGLVWPGTLGCRFYVDAPDRVRKPDVTFVRRERFSPAFYDDGFLTIRPDIVVEVVSTNDLAKEVDEKIEEYLEAGVPLVWIVYPESRSVQVHRPDSTVTKLHETDELTGENIFPGFRCKVAELFPIATV